MRRRPSAAVPAPTTRATRPPRPPWKCCACCSPSMSDNVPTSRRGLARRLTVQALYQWLVNETSPEALLRQFAEEPEGLGRADPNYFSELLQGVVQARAELTAP